MIFPHALQAQHFSAKWLVFPQFIQVRSVFLPNRTNASCSFLIGFYLWDSSCCTILQAVSIDDSRVIIKMWLLCCPKCSSNPLRNWRVFVLLLCIQHLCSSHIRVHLSYGGIVIQSFQLFPQTSNLSVIISF